MYIMMKRRQSIARCNVAVASSALHRSSWSKQTIPTLVVFVLFVSSILTSTTRTVNAFSTGAGACTGGATPVGGFHLETTNPDGSERTVLSGALSDGMVTVLINNNRNDPLVENTPYILQTQTLYTLTVVTTQEPGYKGILIRFSNTDNTVDVPNDVIAEPSDSLLQIAEACNSETNTIGLTHVTNIEKLSVTADITLNAPGTIVLDISIVGVNDEIASLYGHTGYILQIEGDAITESPTLAPIVATTLPPGTTAIPTTSPTLGDFLIDTLSPTYKIPPPSSSSSNNNKTNNVTGTSDAMSSVWFMTPSILATTWTSIVVVVWSVTSLLL